MGPVSASTTIDVPRERVFAFLGDLAHRPAFMAPFVSDYRLERLDSVGTGAAARFRIRELGVWMETVIEEVEPPHRIFERGHGGRLDRIPIHTVWELTEGPSASSCEARVTFWTEPSNPLDRLRERLPGAERFYRVNLSQALARLKDLLESGRAPERVVVAGGDRIPGAG